MESSDEDFVWTNTSKDDSDSEVEMPYDGESESGKSYKEKLQKELFQNGELDSSTEAEEPNKRKKKHKREKSPRASPSPASASGHDDSAAAEHILNMKVKEERASFVAPRDSPRASTLEPEHARSKKKKKRERNEDHESSATEAPDVAESPRKKKKRKRDSERTSTGDQSLILDKFEAEEAVVQQRVKVNGHAQTDKRDPRGPGSGTRGYPSKEFVEDDDSSDQSRPAPARPSDADTAAGDQILDMKVKDECASFVAPRDSPRASGAEPGHARSKKKKKRERNEDHESSATEAPDVAESPRKKKKRKRDSERTSGGDQSLILDKFEAQEAVVQQRVKVNGHAQTDKRDLGGPGSGTRGYPSKELVEDDDSSDRGKQILNMKVKDESASFVAPRESPRASTLEPGHARSKKKKKRERNEDHESSATEAPDVAESPRKKKKRKRDSERTSTGDQSLILDKFEAEEAVVQQRVKVNGHAQTDKQDPRGPGSGTRGYPSKEFIEDDDYSSKTGAPRVQTDNGEGVWSIANCITFEEPEAEPEISKSARGISERITFEEPEAEPEISKSARGISERITFEEPEAEPEISKSARGISERITIEESQSESERRPAGVRLGRYLRAHAHMQPVLGELAPGAAVTADDDVWVLRAPRDLDARALAGATLALDARSSLKAGGRALEAAPAGGAARVALLLPAARGRGFCVRAVPARGALRLRARPPRVRAPPAAAAAAAEEPERVPAPATRARHPLLGAGYEQAAAAALAPDVRRRLAAAAARDRHEPDAPDNDDTERRDKKKNKNKHRERPEPIVELRPETEEPKPKKRKRKHGSRAEPDPRESESQREPDPRESESRREPDSPPRKKKKKVKKEKKDEKRPRRDDAAVWDSERAIEESLFDF